MNPLLKKLHHRLLPAQSELGVLPYVWLVYLFIFILPAIINPVQDWKLWATLASAIGFLFLYFYTFWQNARITLYCILAILLLGMISATFNPGASVFFVYSAAFCVQLNSKKKAKTMVFLIAFFAALYSYVMTMPAYFYLPAIVISILIGMVNIYEAELKAKNKQLRVSQDELRKAAATAERERIARDLHDIIGHTFSLITIKAQLAQKLIAKDTEKALKEVQDLEQLSRDAMAEVRGTVTQYQTRDISSEISKAKILMQSAEIDFDCVIDGIPASKIINSTVAFVIRELMTNLVKHANADHCELHLQQTDKACHLRISDNGKLKQQDIQEGNGLRGIRERINALNGHVNFKIEKGFNAIIEVPTNA